MTAIVGVLNKKGIAIAADSAVTFSSGKRTLYNEDGKEEIVSDSKILNSGDKMLRLKDGQPVAVMIVGNSHLCLSSTHHLPWDVIIRWYRKQHDHSGFPSLIEYIRDLMGFVNSDILEGTESFKPSEATYLVFAGYAENDSYPSICCCEVPEVKNGKISCLLPKDFQAISDKRESAVFALGMPYIIDSIKYGIQEERIDPISRQFPCMLTDMLYKVGRFEQAQIIDRGRITCKVQEQIQEYKVKHYSKWLEVIKKYDLRDMAALAENLIKATALHRKITFQQENVGGLVDLALITRNDGFQWLNRKSWYEPSRGGQYGKFGI